MKISLKDITFCIPIRIESFYRLNNLNCLIEYINKYIDTNILILEADQKQNYHPPRNYSGMQYLFIKDDSQIFFRTKYINQILSIVKTPFASIWDTDAIAPIKQIEAAYDILLEDNMTLVYPYSGIFLSVSEYISTVFRNSLDIQILNKPYLHRALLNGYYSVGGAYMINVKKYKKAGGENEHFYGWGPEDAERFYRLKILNHKMRRIDGVLYHLHHSRGLNSTYSNVENAIKSKQELCKVCSMTLSELESYVQSWKYHE